VLRLCEHLPPGRWGKLAGNYRVHQGRVPVVLGVWASAQPADVRRFPPRDAVVARLGWGTIRWPPHDGCGGGEVIVGALSTCAGAAAGQGGGGSS